MIDIKVRKATLSDVDQVFKLVNELENNSLNAAAFRSTYHENLSNSFIYYIVAENDSKIIGFASLHIQNLLHHTGKVAEIQELFVDPSFRGGGIGYKLFGYAKEIARDADCVLLEVSSNIKREQAHKFYEEKAKLTKSHYKFTSKL